MKPEQEQACRKCGMTEQEIEELKAYDKAIDQGDKELGTLTPEQEKAAKQAKLGTWSKHAPTTKERKPNETKREIMELMLGALKSAGSIELINPEREATFELGGTKYKVVLSCPRK